MLDQVLHPHIKNRISQFIVTTTNTPSASVGKGGQDVSTIVRNAAGRSTLTPKEAYIKEPIVVSTPSTNADAGGFSTFNTVATGNAIVNAFLDHNGSAAEATQHCLALGWDYDDDNARVLQTLFATFQNPRIIFCKVSANGTVSIGGKLISVTKTATGVYPIKILTPFQQSCVALVCPIGTTFRGSQVVSVTNKTLTVNLFTMAASAVDNDFYLLLLGSDELTEVGRQLEIVQTARLYPRLLAFRITNTGGTMTLTQGKSDATLTKNGTGDYSLTYATPFALSSEAGVFAMGKGTRAQARAATTNTAARIILGNATGTATDDDVYVFVLGFDYANEFDT